MANSEGKPSDLKIKPKQQETAAECLGGICLSDHLSDISFTFPNSQTKLPAHKLFLSMRSKVFEAMFYGPLAEKHDTVAIEDVDIATMEMILRFIYKDEAQLDGNNVLACLYAGMKYDLDGLVGRCTAFLETSITLDNVCAIHEQAVFYELTALQTKCFEYMIDYSGDVLKSDGMVELSNTSLQNLLASDNLSTDEHDNFVAAYKWAIHQCTKKNLTPDKGNIRACLGNVLFEIRFPLMPIDVFGAKVDSTGILTKDEMLMLYKFLASQSRPTEASSRIGRFSCKERVGVPIVWNIANIVSNDNVNGYQLILSTSSQIKILSLRGSFVNYVSSIDASSTGAVYPGYMQEIMFKRVNDDQIIFIEPVFIAPYSRNLQLNFHIHGGFDGFGTVRSNYAYTYGMGMVSNHVSNCVDMNKSLRNMNITLSRVPCGLTEIQFRRL